MLIVLSIDGLSAAALGCYGNDWVGTPAIDALAAESVLLDFAVSDDPSLQAMRSFWSGASAIARQAGLSAEANEELAEISFAGRLKSAGWRSLLVTDDRSILTFPEAAAFDEQVSMNVPLEPKLQEDASRTHLAPFFANAAEALHEFGGSKQADYIVWLHTGSLATIWDAPLEYRNRYQEEDDPAPPVLASPPHQRIPTGESLDPDQLLGLRRAYAGQVALLDELLEMFLGFLRESGFLQQAHFLLLAPRGFGLGEHGMIGYPNNEFALHEEYLHVPWLWRFPDTAAERHAAEHFQNLVQPADLLPTLLELLELDESAGAAVGDGTSFGTALQDSEAARRRLAISVSPEGQSSAYALRSPAWQLNKSQCDGETTTALYAKPDDRWEMNNVADRCPEIVAQLADYAAKILNGETELQCASLDTELTDAHS